MIPRAIGFSSSFLILGVAFFLSGCPSKTPSTPSGGSPSLIHWESANVTYVNYYGNSPFQVVSLLLQVDGQPENSATVTLAGSGVPGPMEVPSLGTTTVDAEDYTFFRTYSGFTYQPGTTYSLTTTTSAGTASATLTAPGGVVFAPDRSNVSWSYDGNACNFVGVHVLTCIGPCTCGWRLEYDCDAVSPVDLTPGYDSCLGSYDLWTTLRSSASVAGADGSSTFEVIETWRAHNPP